MSDNLKKTEIWIVGAGSMAYEYVKVLNDLNKSYLVIGRKKNNVNSLKDKIMVENIYSGGLENFIKKNNYIPEFAINAVNVENLKDTTLLLMKSGIKNILLEKPGGINKEEIREIINLSRFHNSNIYVAYNRRFFSSILTGLDIIKKDNGIKSIFFEFTEWSHIIANLSKPTIVKQNWILANSSHVIDLAFFFAGLPKKFSTFKSGGLDWHKNGSIFVGAGITELDIPFCYHANWESPGRWNVEIMTKNHRLIFKPMEELYIQKTGSIKIDQVKINNKLDIKYKPGLYLQTKNFIENNKDKLLSIQNQLENIEKIYDLITNPR